MTRNNNTDEAQKALFEEFIQWGKDRGFWKSLMDLERQLGYGRKSLHTSKNSKPFPPTLKRWVALAAIISSFEPNQDEVQNEVVQE